MNILKSIFVLYLFTFAITVWSQNTFEFDPEIHTAQLGESHIWFQDKSSTPVKIGPELFDDETYTNFFSMMKNVIIDATAINKKVKLRFENINSQNHGQYARIVPDS